MSVLAAFAVPHPPLILPDVGRGEEKKISATTKSYQKAMRRAAALKPETIVLSSPHSAAYADYFHISPGRAAKGDMAAFRAGNVKIETEYDMEFVDLLSRIAEKTGVPAGMLGEREASLDHATVVPLYFLNKVYTDYKLVRIGLAGLSPLMHYQFGRCIAQAAEKLGRRVVFIASGDLSHKLTKTGPYGFAPEGPEFDRQLTEAFGKGDFMALLRFSREFADAAAECGLRSFQIMAGALDGKAVTHELLSYEGPFGVGYGVAAFEVTGEDETRNFGARYEREELEREKLRRAGEDEYVRLARLSLETFVKTGKHVKMPGGLPDEMAKRRAGTFVSLKKHGQLRGCIGTISATTGSVAEEILQNAVSAAAHDPRFTPVTHDELGDLVYSVDVLGETEDIQSPAQLDVKKYGVIVTNGRRRGLLLPNLEGVDTVEEQISIAKQKAGIGSIEEVKLQRFEVVRHK
ncbi:hypothetical protein SDC9_91384 [bioreactor metagenome]|uniref:AMMECR1 domain-containing protein n=1 Tax=bioreactor metagenome TaxID=1076179 RepID=A0A645A1J4_9ZZZZ